MRKLLLFFAMLCVSVGMWAAPGDPYEIMGTESWNNGAEQAVKVKLNQSGSLSDAITAIAANSSYNACQIVLFEFDPNFTFSDADKTALSSLNFATIDLQKYKGAPFTFTNSNVKYVTLPDTWTKADVKAAGVALSTSATFEAALCQGTSNNEPFLTAYSNKAGSLSNAIPHLFWKEAEYKIGTGVGDCSKLNVLTAMGNVCAKDISRAGVYDSNGHYVINGVADENLIPENNANKNTEGGLLYAGANDAGAVDGAIKGCYGIRVIDLKDAIIQDAYCADIVPGYAFITTDLREVWIPEDPNFKTIPADFLNGYGKIHQICIPGNIEIIRTRAFAGPSVNYIWTTGSDPSIRYDNGATFITNAGQANEERAQRYKTEVGKGITATAGFDPATEYPIFQDGDDNSFNYGTFTLPAGLKLIERYAFYTSTSVSDVYMLGTTAPECHVDGFNSSMYHANNTVQDSSIKEETDDEGNTIKIITREAYNNGINQPMTILHYPQDTTTPDLQRYTDPTREYSIATGYRDGKGNMLYFPTQTEFEVAEWEGTYGYLWNAWNIERTWYNQEVTLGTGGGWYGFEETTGGYTLAGQEKANKFYNENPNPNPSTGTDKTDRSFYDVTADGTLSQPAGLKMYYNTVWEGSTLYPQMETTPTTEVIGERQVLDENGNPKFEPGNCNYVKDYRYVKDDEGGFVQVATVTGYEGTQSPVDGVNTYYSDNIGATATTPKVGSGLYYVSGEQNVYAQVDKNNDAIGAQNQYYTKNGDTYTPSDLMFSNNLYYYSEEGEVKGWVQEYGYTNPNANHYTSQDLTGTPIKAGETGFDYNALYWVYYTDVVHYIASNHFIPGKTWYSYDQNNKTYTALTLSWYTHFTGDYYYVSGTTPTYASAQGLDYNSSTTYYSDQNGTEATSITFNQTYYIPTYDYTYETYSGQEGDRYKQEEYYREGTSEELADANVEKYCPVMEPVYAVVKGKQNDYRGWHQFVLANYGYNGVVPNEPIRSFISDNDWWTICEPYDLRYNDLIMFFGTNISGIYKKPYLSKLMYVIRDVEKGKITLMFSKNLMEYKEATASDDQVHGTIDDETTWIGNGEGQYADEAALRAANPVILHKGVPYLIKPNLLVDDNGNVGNRSFNVYKTDNLELYTRLKEAGELGAGAQASMVYDGEYTVPAYVVGLGKDGAGTEGVESSGKKTITNRDGSSFTYKDSENGGKLVYGGKEVDYKISSENTYTFVGSLYKSLMPQYCYFLGYDSKKKKAVFRYSAVQDKSGWNWNNETGIICPNFDTSTKIHSATGFNDPARWAIADANGTMLQPDDITMPTSTGAKSYTFDFGATNYFEMDEATGVSEMVVKPIFEETKVYDTNGVYRGSSLQNLPKGVYIVNGKKYVVK